jgi:hypothetical protein
MVLARSIEDRAFADELREAAMDIALSLGPWQCRTSEERRERAESTQPLVAATKQHEQHAL